MHKILYLHGFGEKDPERTSLARALVNAAGQANVQIHPYHPDGKRTTRIVKTLKACEDLIQDAPSARVHLIGYSLGGLLAAILAERRPDLVVNLLLLAPAIDNFERNYAGRDPADWMMPVEYVAELQTFAARPKIVRPTTMVHGMQDVDQGGSAPWRIQEWAAEQSFDKVYLLDEVDHTMEPWLSASDWEQDGQPVPTFEQLVGELVSAA